jgi:hypothetical protein
MTVTALLARLITESCDQLDSPGIVFRGPANDRRAALAAGPDVWGVRAHLHPGEIVSRLQERVPPDKAEVWCYTEICAPDPYTKLPLSTGFPPNRG